MITSIKIENFRGIRTGSLEPLAPLTILTGPNACGKSAVLDALLIAASPDPADAVGRAVARHPATTNGGRWLFHRDLREARIQLTADTERPWYRIIKWYDHCQEGLESELVQRRSQPPYSMVHVQEAQWADESVSSWIGFGSDNQYVVEVGGGSGLSPIPFVRLVDPGLPKPLHRTFTEVTRAGRRDMVHDLLGKLIPGFERLEIIAVTESDFGLAVTKNGSSVPLGLSGDGIQAFTQLALEIGVAPSGLVLVEEPEVYQHPKAIRENARVIFANVRRGVQLVLTTHSLELLDALLAEAGDDVEMLALFGLTLENGELNAGRRSGTEIEFAREHLESDLR